MKVEHTNDATISDKIMLAINNGRLALPARSSMKKWRGLDLAIDVLSWSRNAHDGYQITANQNGSHVCTIVI